MTSSATSNKHDHRDLTVDDFLTGLIAGLASRSVATVSLRGESFYQAIEQTFDRLRSEATARDLDLRFRVFRDPIYGDSAIVRDAISGAVQRDLVSLDNPEYLDMRLKVGPEEALLLLERLPGGQELFLRLADEFLHQYRWVVRRPV